MYLYAGKPQVASHGPVWLGSVRFGLAWLGLVVVHFAIFLVRSSTPKLVFYALKYIHTVVYMGMQIHKKKSEKNIV